LKKFMKEG
jgi:hypothetical protein